MMQELSMNVLDVAENSVRAGAKLIEITVDEQPGNDLLTIAIRDDGCGMTKEQLQSVTDPFFTTRTTRKVGLGVPFFKLAAEITGGSFDIQSKPGGGTAVTAKFVRSSIDRMPLGDMNETMLTLIGCNPETNFLYTRRFGEDELVLDTRQFRAELGGIPLSEPAVLKFISEFLSENTAELLAGHENE